MEQKKKQTLMRGHERGQKTEGWREKNEERKLNEEIV